MFSLSSSSSGHARTDAPEAESSRRADGRTAAHGTECGAGVRPSRPTGNANTTRLRISLDAHVASRVQHFVRDNLEVITYHIIRNKDE